MPPRAATVTPDRIRKWQERKSEEEKRQKFGVVEERIIYYADFYDLKTILKKHWEGDFSQALGDWRTMELWLDELGRLRDPDAHRRELLPHQKHLALGISGEIRTRLVRYRSKQEAIEDYFPRIESARDSFGNIWTLEGSFGEPVFTNTILRPDDTVEFVITASDPLGEEIEYGIERRRMSKEIWQKSNLFSIIVIEDNISKNFVVSFYIRSFRKFHAYRYYDDSISFYYTVLPKKAE